MRTRIALAVAALALLGLASGCGGEPPSSSAVAPGAGNPDQLPNGPYAQFDRDAAVMVRTVATWQHPAKLVVGKAERVGLTMGQSQELKDKMDVLVKNGVKTPAGQVEVGPTVRITLQADPEDAEITPSEAVDASTGSTIAMLWTWLVKAKQPTEGLTLTAHMEIPLSDGHVATNDLPLSIPVERTVGYTVNQILTNWATWASVGTSIVGVGGWFLRRAQRRRKRLAQPQPVSTSA